MSLVGLVLYLPYYVGPSHPVSMPMMPKTDKAKHGGVVPLHTMICSPLLY